MAVEYDGFDWHSDPDSFSRDRQKRAALQEIGWTVVSIVADDVRRRPWDMVRRIEVELVAIARGVSVRKLASCAGVSTADTHARARRGR